MLFVRFENVTEGEVSLFVDGKEQETEEWLTNCAAVRFVFKPETEYRVEVRYPKKTKLQKWLSQAKKTLLLAEGDNNEKQTVFRCLEKAESEEEFLRIVEECKLASITKLKLRETL